MSFNSLPPSPPKTLVEICGDALVVSEADSATISAIDMSSLTKIPRTSYTISDKTCLRLMTAHASKIATLDTANVLHLVSFDHTKEENTFNTVAEWKLPKSETFTCLCWNQAGNAIVISTANGTLYRINTVTFQIDPFGAIVGGAITSVSASPCGDNIFAIAHKSGSISVISITSVLEVYHTFKLSSRNTTTETNVEGELPIYALTSAWHYSSRKETSQSLAVIDSNNKIQVWSISLKSSVRKIRCFRLPDGANSTSPIWWSKGGCLFHAINNSRVCIHNVRTSEVSTRIISTGGVVSCCIKSSQGKVWLVTNAGVEHVDLMLRERQGSMTDNKAGKVGKRIGIKSEEQLLSPPRSPLRNKTNPLLSEDPTLAQRTESAQSDSWDEESDSRSQSQSHTSSTSTDTFPLGYDFSTKPLLNLRPRLQSSVSTTLMLTDSISFDTSGISLFNIDMSVSDPTTEIHLSPELSWESQALQVLFDWELSCYELIQKQRTEGNAIANFYLGQWLNDNATSFQTDLLDSSLAPTPQTALLCLSLLDRDAPKVDKILSAHVSQARSKFPSGVIDTHYICTTLLSLGLYQQAIYVYQQLGFFMEATILGILYAHSIQETLELWIYSASLRDFWDDGVINRCSVLMSLVKPQAPRTYLLREGEKTERRPPPELRQLSLDDLLKSTQNMSTPRTTPRASPLLPSEDFTLHIESPTMSPIDGDFNYPWRSRRIQGLRTPTVSPKPF